MAEPFLKLSAELRREALETAAGLAERPDYLLEKDVWVVQALEELYGSPFAEDLTFKGGTSLSKAYHAIRRFSEDVDLTYDIRKIAPDLVDAGNPEALTASQARKWSKTIREERLPAWLAEKLAPFLDQRLSKAGLPAQVRQVGADLFIDYESVTRPPGYVPTSVKLEFGARATGEPNEIRDVVCDAAPHLPTLTFPSASARVMRVERTFWEKATAMHVFCVQGHYRGDARGFARHWHDLVRLDDSGFAKAALADHDLALAVAAHKTKFFPEKAPDRTPIDYVAAVSGKLQLVARDDGYRVLAEDYAAMVDAGVLLNDVETFDNLMTRCQSIADRANAAGGPL